MDKGRKAGCALSDPFVAASNRLRGERRRYHRLLSSGDYPERSPTAAGVREDAIVRVHDGHTTHDPGERRGAHHPLTRSLAGGPENGVDNRVGPETSRRQDVRQPNSAATRPPPNGRCDSETAGGGTSQPRTTNGPRYR